MSVEPDQAQTALLLASHSPQMSLCAVVLDEFCQGRLSVLRKSAELEFVYRCPPSDNVAGYTLIPRRDHVCGSSQLWILVFHRLTAPTPQLGCTHYVSAVMCYPPHCEVLQCETMTISSPGIGRSFGRPLMNGQRGPAGPDHQRVSGPLNDALGDHRGSPALSDPVRPERQQTGGTSPITRHYRSVEEVADAEDVGHHAADNDGYRGDGIRR